VGFTLASETNFEGEESWQENTIRFTGCFVQRQRRFIERFLIRMRRQMGLPPNGLPEGSPLGR